MIRREGDHLFVSGDLTIQTVAALHAGGLPSDVPQLYVDLAGVGAVDSAAVGLLLAWQRQVQARGGVIQYRNLPANLHSLVRLYDVTELIPS